MIMNQFKKCKVVMLPTNEKAIDGQFCIGKYEEYALIDNIQMQNKLSCGTKVMDGDIKMSYQHIYITSDEEIKQSDWYINLNTNKIDICNYHDESISINKFANNYCIKIIATTDKRLKRDFNMEFANIAPTVQGNCCPYSVEESYLPQPSQQFIEKYIEEYNKGNVITDVLVEYIDNGEEGWSGSNEDGEPIWNEKIELKVNPKGNTITIKKVKDSWNREEVFKLCRDSHYAGSIGIDRDIWIEQNL